MSPRFTLGLAAAAMFLAVALGAFGAHALKARLTAEMASAWQTAVLYHALHALALFGLGLLMLHWPERTDLPIVGWLFAAGIVLFSGSLYLMALTDARALGAVTPIGGVTFLLGWAILVWAIART
jgi:uncharacterized membrane protein YgdD (TMEM256/DUF423 family)